MPKQEHHNCVNGCIEKLKPSHNCVKESKLFRNGMVHALDVECHPTSNFLRTHRPAAIECENQSSKLQRASNWQDLMVWQLKNSDGAVFQIENANELKTDKLKKKRLPLYRMN